MLMSMGRATATLTLSICLASGAMTAAASAADTLSQVRDRGAVVCGVTELGRALSTMDAAGDWVGFYPDVCRAFAAAAVGDADAVDFVMLSTSDRFNALRAEAIDVLSEPTTWTLGRDTAGLEFTTPIFHDGQGFLTYGKDNLKTVSDLKGRSVCVQGNSTSVSNLRELDKGRGLDLDIQEFGTIEGAYSAFYGRRCAALSTDSLILASMRSSLAPNPADYTLLDEIISHEPLAMAVRDDNSKWEDVIRWTVHALVTAERLGITAANVATLSDDGRPEVKRLLHDAELAASLGLEPGWAQRAIASVGNYGEIYERSIGASGLGLPRGRNALLEDGGLMWAPPLR